MKKLSDYGAGEAGPRSGTTTATRHTSRTKPGTSSIRTRGEVVIRMKKERSGIGTTARAAGRAASSPTSSPSEVDVFELAPGPTVVCACGIPFDFLHGLAKGVGLSVDDYVFWRSRLLTFDLGGGLP